ncbi:Nn.00g055240.m01.CDS01 [Neocucurbitaria sp. VM-36]
MDNRQGEQQRPLGSSTVSTTTTQGPFTTTTVSSTTPGRGTTVTHSGPHSTTVTSPTITTTTRAPPSQPSPAPPSTQRVRSSSIRIRRPQVQQDVQSPQPTQASLLSADDARQGNRRRSSSEPRPPPSALLQEDDGLRRQLTAQPTPLQPLYEEGAPTGYFAPKGGAPPSRGPSTRRQGLNRQISAINIRRKDHQQHQHTMQPNVVDVLDVIDPEISALTTLNNVQNSLFLPNLPWLYNRQPTYDLAQSASGSSSDEETGTAAEARREDQFPEMTQQGEIERAARGGLTRTNTIDSILSTMDEGPGHHYAVLPHGASLTGWSDEEKAALDDHVRHLLHSRRAKFKRSMRGFGRYMRNPLGFIVTLYFFLITFWGAAWVLFLIGWIYVGDRQDYFVEIADQILTALFCVVGITMFPFRIVDTYHMAFVAYYAHRTWRLRKERGLGDLKDHNELPNMPQSSAWESGEAEGQGMEVPVLTAKEQTNLEHHQAKLAKSHTFYRPHETYTHHAFSIRLLITIIVLLDCHSMFQCALGGTTWGIYYKVRPKALTAVILSCSLTCNITAGILIGRGDKRSRKKLVVEQILRQEMTEEALKKLKKERGLRAKGLMTKKQKQQVQKEMGEEPKNPLDTILHRG